MRSRICRDACASAIRPLLNGVSIEQAATVLTQTPGSAYVCAS
ncbi:MULTISPECIES: hypothetical protein [Paraburkholderia]|nr:MULTISPECIES: hypothetical protein [Paraburkholderia]MDH6148180.1 hypothetical protein [Paraburkholderia sp. WSM4179]